MLAPDRLLPRRSLHRDRFVHLDLPPDCRIGQPSAFAAAWSSDAASTTKYPVNCEVAPSELPPDFTVADSRNRLPMSLILSPRVPNPRCSQDGAARCRLNRGHAAAVEHDEPITMSSA